MKAPRVEETGIAMEPLRHTVQHTADGNYTTTMNDPTGQGSGNDVFGTQYSHPSRPRSSVPVEGIGYAPQHRARGRDREWSDEEGDEDHHFDS